MKTRGWLTPVVAMAAAPVADMATVTAADHERISKFCRVNLQGLWLLALIVAPLPWRT